MRRGLLRLAWGLMLLTLTGVAGVAGVALWGWALYRLLAGAASPEAAALLMGLVALGLAWLLAWSSLRLNR